MAFPDRGGSSADPPRRLAVVDMRFPWRISGFRYWDAFEILRQRPDTLFFAWQVWEDDFPAPVFPFTEFEAMARREGITDVYCVFLNLTLSLLGCSTLPSGESIPGGMPFFDVGSLLSERGIRVHSVLYPGGGLGPDTPTEFLRRVGERCATVFTNAEEVRAAIPGTLPVGPIVNTDFYRYVGRVPSRPIELTFSHYNAARKNFPVLAEAFNRLDDAFHLNLVGNWESELHRLTNPHYTFYGMLDPERVNEIHRSSLAFIACSSQDQYSVDGFPTASAADAMATGCLVISTNHRKENEALKKSVHYVEIEVDSADSLHEALLWLRDHTSDALAIAAAGAATARRLFDSRRVVASKLSAIFGAPED
jgi:glycosyltransferase involved in cell wall biosynthesis